MISVSRLTKLFGNTTALDGVTLSVAPGQTLAVVGPSGCGKTTLLRLVAGLEKPDEGEVVLHGTVASRPGWALPPHERNVGFVFQSAALWPHMSVAQNISFGMNARPRDQARATLAALLDQLDLRELAGRHPHQLSGGQARRVALARALAPQPRILLLDEPLTNLDGELKSRVLGVIQDAIRATRPAVIHVTHDPAEAAALGAQTLTLREGRIVGGGA
ncbi:MAG: ABC transporter ATP-binding protein [Verrucomicrobia bacterium]|nr:ABC transporter ATP-binding protein [Verrucomicrobiota bacterium]